MEDFLCGGAASIAAISCTHPMDVVKTKLQFQGEQLKENGKGINSLKPKQGKAYNGILSSLTSIWKHEGIPGLYRGLLPAYGLQFSVTATRFGFYSIVQQVMDIENPNLMTRFLQAGVAGAIGAVAGNPWYALKTRAQAFSTSPELAVGTQHSQNLGVLSQFGGIYKTEGVPGYFRGLEAFMPRVVAYGAVQLSVYDTAKESLQSVKYLADRPFFLQVCSSVVASCSSVMAIQPFDFIAARLMNQPIDPVTKKGLLYDGVLDCVVKSVRNEGVLVLSKGGAANFARMGPYSALVLLFVEQFKKLAASLHRE
mmetsp:Transcript_7191/g.8224  ORF Transcript_7191/g.8224 Transcript_7191/m.8224 type:complete len:311 (+) Transcript_7191:174-1106(+)